MKPGQAGDAIVFDRIYGDTWDTTYLDPHHNFRDDYRSIPYTENCVGYGDGHAEVHRHKFDKSLSNPQCWDGEYLEWTGYQYYLY